MSQWNVLSDLDFPTLWSQYTSQLSRIQPLLKIMARWIGILLNTNPLSYRKYNYKRILAKKKNYRTILYLKIPSGVTKTYIKDSIEYHGTQNIFTVLKWIM